VSLATLSLLAALASPVLANEGEAKKKPAKKERAPVESPAIDKRVAEAKVIFVGEGTRIFFIDRRYQEVPYIRALGEGTSKSALISVRVVKVLHSTNVEMPTRVFVPIETNKGDIFGDARSVYDEQVERYVGKQNVWFGEIVVRTDYGDEKSGRKPLEDPLTFLQAWDSKKRPIASVLPIAQLKEVENSIKRTKPSVAAKAENR
jgi:hypothetical protein